MLRFLSRFLGFWLVAAALVAAIVDGAKSIAASAFVTTSLGEVWATIAAALRDGSTPVEPAPAAEPLDAALALLLAAPAVAVLLVAGILFLLAGSRRRRRHPGREYVT